jgi:hypothetical protein
MSSPSDISGEMHRTELSDESVERLLSGTAVSGHEDVSTLMRQLRAVYTDPAPTPVGAALAEFVDVQPTAANSGGEMSATDYYNLLKPVTPVIELSAPLDVESTRRSAMLWKKVSASVIVAGAGVVFLASLASAGSSLGDGDYTLVLPGVGEFEFKIDSDGDDLTGETVIAVRALPDDYTVDYTVDDDDLDKVAWKNWASLEVEVEIHEDKIEGDVDWGPDGDGIATLALPGGGSITVTAPDGAGYFTVTASDGWWAFGSGSDWFVANNYDIAATATDFFKVEATADGIEIKAVDGPDAGFLKELEEEEEEEELEVEIEEVENEDDEPGDGNGNGRGRGNSGG